MVEAGAAMTTTCTRCHRPLKQPHTRERGFGDICWGKHQANEAQRQNEKEISTFGNELLFERRGGVAACSVPYRMHIHSQDFEWGYGGSGPADLALNILLECGVSEQDALDLHQEFKWTFISTMPFEGGRIDRRIVVDWAIARGAKSA
jgi:hypothetical protein